MTRSPLPRTPLMVAWLTVTIALLATTTVLLTGMGPRPAGPATAAAADTRALPPDVVVILTDDQRAGTQVAMPYTWRFFTKPRAVNYDNAQIPTNLCCPSRIAFLTGKLPTVTGGWDNAGRFGGVKAIRRWEHQAIPLQLQQRGYTTGLFGKYVNGFGGDTPPGWNEFAVFDGPGGSGYYTDVRGVPDGYTTDTLGTATARFIRSAPTNQPLFAYYSPFAPHANYDAGPYKDSATDAQVAAAKRGGDWSNPSFNTVTPGQPNWVQRLSPVTRSEQERITRLQTATLMGVDANVKRIVTAVARHRDVSNTLFVFMSDNGYSWGDHRGLTKRSPYVTANEIPLMVRYPAGSSITPGTDSRLANNVDVSATILATAGLPNTTDGLPLTSPVQRGNVPLMAAATIARKDSLAARPSYCGIRTPTWVYVRYGSGEHELYDLTRDPYQLANVADENPQRVARMARQVAATGCDTTYLENVVTPRLPAADE